MTTPSFPRTPIHAETSELLRALSALSDITDTSKDLPTLLTDVLETVQAFSDSVNGSIYLVGDDNYTLYHAAQIRKIPQDNPNDGSAYRLSADDPIGRALAEDVSRYEPSEDAPTIAYLPLIAVGQPLGVLYLENQPGDPFSPLVRHGLDVLARHIAALILAARNAAEARATTSQLIVFYVFGSRILGANSLPKVFDLTVRFILEATTAHSVLIQLYDESDHSVHIFGRDRKQNPLPASAQQELDPVSQRIRVSRRPVAVSGYEDNVDELVSLELRRVGIAAYVGLPVHCAASGMSGALFVNYSDEHIFSSMELEGLRLYTDQIAGVIDHLFLMEQSRQRQADLESVIDTVHILTSTLNVAELMQQISVRMTWIANVDACSIAAYEPERGRVRFLAGFSPIGIPDGPEIGDYLYLEEFPATAELMRASGQMVVHADSTERLAPEAAVLRRYGYTTSLLFSLVATTEHRETLGVMALYSRQPGFEFSQTVLRRMRLLSEQVALALMNARHYENEHRQLNLAEALRKISLALSGSLQTSAILQELLEQIKAVIPYDTAAVVLVEGDETHTAFQRGYEDFGVDNLVSETHWKIRETPTLRRLAEHGRPFYIRDVRKDPEWVHQPHLEHVRSWLGAPLVAQDRLFGFLMLDKAEPDYYTAEHIQSIEILAAHAVLALINASRYDEVERAAITDFLTGAFNHRHFHQRLLQELERARTNERQLSLLMMDLDKFKAVNDTYGHPVGDQVLRLMSQRIKAELRGGDILARYGGEEFAVILPGASPNALRQVAARLLSAVSTQPFVVDSGELRMTISIGGATFPDHALDARALVACADNALYHSKHNGRNQFTLGQTGPGDPTP